MTPVLNAPTAAAAALAPAIHGVAFAKFMELRGHRVVERCGVLWHSVGHGMYMSLPYHLRPDLDPRDAVGMLRSMDAVGVRYPSLKWSGLPSGLYVCRRRDYDIPTLHRNFRAHVRHGQPFCEIRSLTEKDLLSDALRINRETMHRQHRYDSEFGDAVAWRRFVRAVQECPCITPIGAFIDGRLGSYAITCFEDGWLHILYKMTDLQFDFRHPSQVLDFSITRRIATDPSVTAVSMGWAPLVPSAKLHEYKMRLGYDFEAQSSVIRLRPALERCFDTPTGRWALQLVRGVGRPSQTVGMALAVFEGMTRTRAQFRQ